MINVDLRKWDYIKDQKEWELFKKSLTDKETSLYHTFMSYRSHLSKTEKKIDKLNKDLEIQKDKKRDYLIKLTELNSKIDYLRNEFNISISCSPWDKEGKGKNFYCMITFSRTGTKKISCNLGNIKRQVKPRLLEFYKTKYKKKKLFTTPDLDDGNGRRTFCFNLVNELDRKENLILLRQHFRQNPQLKSLNGKVCLDLMFPLKPKGVSIPIMITNKMRMKLLTLGYTRDEMKHLTPIECHDIINKGVPKKPSRERGRNQ